jgi:hypothetical protein
MVQRANQLRASFPPSKIAADFPKAFESIALLPDAIDYQLQGNMVKAKSKLNSRRAYYYEGGELLSR